MPYLNLDLDYFDHPKTRRLIGLLGRNTEVLPLRLWSYCGKFHSEDGRLTGYSSQEVESIVGWWGKPGEAVDAMVRVHILEATEDGYEIHGWKEHQGHIKALRDRAANAAKKRWENIATTQPVEAKPPLCPGHTPSTAKPGGRACSGPSIPSLPSPPGGGQPANGYPHPSFEELPKPLYPGTATKLLRAVDEQIEAVKKMAEGGRIPIMDRTAEGTEYRKGWRYPSEAAEVLQAWDKRKKQITRALAG